MKKTDAQGETREAEQLEQDEKQPMVEHRPKETEIEAELDNESGRDRHFVEPEQRW